jgi:hypothetical protein
MNVKVYEASMFSFLFHYLLFIFLKKIVLPPSLGEVEVQMGGKVEGKVEGDEAFKE